MLLTALESARDSEVAAEQIAILERAVKNGEVTLEDLHQSLENTYRCLEDAGIRVNERTATTPWGTVEVTYEMSVPTSVDADSMYELSEVCIDQHSYFVEYAYSMQPSTVEAKDHHRETVVGPGIERCLETFGIKPDAETFDQLWDQAFFARRDQGDAVVDGGTLRECLDPVMEQAG